MQTAWLSGTRFASSAPCLLLLQRGGGSGGSGSTLAHREQRRAGREREKEIDSERKRGGLHNLNTPTQNGTRAGRFCSSKVPASQPTNQSWKSPWAFYFYFFIYFFRYFGGLFPWQWRRGIWRSHRVHFIELVFICKFQFLGYGQAVVVVVVSARDLDALMFAAAIRCQQK